VREHLSAPVNRSHPGRVFGRALQTAAAGVAPDG
jgi:hypothetical protein